MVFAARWMNGSVTLPWLLEHPEWFFWVDVCSIAQTQAEAEKAKPPEGA